MIIIDWLIEERIVLLAGHHQLEDDGPKLGQSQACANNNKVLLPTTLNNLANIDAPIFLSFNSIKQTIKKKKV